MLAAVVTALLATGCSGGAPEPGAAPESPAPATTSVTPTPRDLPRSMAALGDSMTRAFLACAPIADCPEASWATGSIEDVRSHRQRLAEAAGRDVEEHNLAVSGARVAGLADQVRQAVAARPEYVTILVGANDACRPSEDSMTPAGEFARDFGTALDALVRGLPEARVLVASIPDLQRLWEIGRDVDRVHQTWERFGVCRSMLGAATDTSNAADERRRRVRARVVAFNAAMARACERHPTCRWDGNAVFEYDFTLAEVSDRDYWHPSREGQRGLAEVAWRAGYWG
ncbi:MAG TPA: GDSL-type esterase/lipase family protein [Frankiaceae bacterium]|nr:GDSL-type esterase/lipase family protein [Frankiaceae bacterium]